MQNQALMLAGGGLVVGVLLAVAISGAQVDGKLEAALEDAEQASAGALEEASAALDARIAALEAGLGEATATAAAETDGKLTALSEEIGQRLDSAAGEAEARVQALEAALGDLAATVASVGQAPVAEALPDMETRGPLGVGQTAIFMEGGLRAFVGALDGDAGTARLNVNGETVTAALGETVTVALAEEECSVALMALDASGATIGANCGTGGGATEAAVADVPPAPEEGFRPGHVAILADGALRVFVSALAADGSAARIAVNGIDTQTVNAGASVSQQVGDRTCEVTVTGVGNGMVGLDGTCG